MTSIIFKFIFILNVHTFEYTVIQSVIEIPSTFQIVTCIMQLNLDKWQW